ncbi:hypothetical protein T12_2847 [Trichinella patagoniensis]|uniref:Uncharacterized protein n=1 Tax=Trichinella patagoniensis TaxID=990121 RepID=A0A0V0ZPB1_9BILA|nr:hypothetical protein T12_2847 [Trichinella patagoniensis]
MSYSDKRTLRSFLCMLLFDTYNLQITLRHSKANKLFEIDTDDKQNSHDMNTAYTCDRYREV